MEQQSIAVIAVLLLFSSTALGFHIGNAGNNARRHFSMQQTNILSRGRSTVVLAYNGMNSDEVFEWLITSTDLLLAESKDPEITASNFTNKSCYKNDVIDSYTSLPSEFSSHREYILQAESVMKSWLKWKLKKPVHVTNKTRYDGVSTLYSVEVPQIVENILKQTLIIYHEWEDLNAQQKISYLTTTRADLVNIAIDAWVRCESNDGNYVDSAVRLLRLLQKEEDGQIISYANEDSYHAVIKACISSRRPQNLERAINLLEEISTVTGICDMGYYDDKNRFSCTEMKLCPATQTYNLVLYGLANCPSVKNAQRAESLLQQMIAKSGLGHDCHPEANTFRQVVSAWAKSGSNKAVENAHRIFDMMLNDFPSILPDASTYNALMTLYIRKHDTGKVLELFDQLVANGRTGPDSCSVNLMLRARTHMPNKLSMEEMNEVNGLLLRMKSLYHVRPTVQSYNVIIDAWAKSGLLDSASRAEGLLDIMEKKCRSGDITAVPDSYTFTSVLNAISRAKNHRAKGSWAEQVFHRMKRLHEEGLGEAPTTPVYNALLNALITSNEKGAHARAKSLFVNLGKMANTRSYNIMIKSHSLVMENEDGILTNFARPSKAKALLYQMEQSNGTAIPDCYSYASVIYAYSRSNVKRKAMKSFGILRKATNAGIKPTIYVFNGVLTACGRTNLREEKFQAFTILVSTLIMIREWTKPDDTTYKVLVKACEQLLPQDETRKKQVLDLVFRELKFQSDPEFHELMVNRFMKMDGCDQELSESIY